MSTNTRKVVYLWFVLVLLVSLGLSASPAQASANPCNPHFVVRSGHTFTVYPSHGDDTANLQCALEAAKAAGSGSTVQLVRGDYLTGFIDVAGFDGYFKGAGMGKTVIHPQEKMDCYSQYLNNINPALITFRLGNPRIQDMTVNIDKANTCDNFETLYGVFYFTGSKLGTDDPCANLKSEYGRGAISRVEIITPVMGLASSFSAYAGIGINIAPENVFFDESSQCLYWQAQTYGDYQVTDSVIHGVARAIVTRSIGPGHIRIAHNTFDQNAYGIWDYGVDGLSLEITGNTFIKNHVAIVGTANLEPFVQANPNISLGKPVTYLFTHNSISLDPANDTPMSWGDPSTGIEVFDFANIIMQQPLAKVVITDNSVIANGLEHVGYWVAAVKAPQVSNNTLKGTGGAGFLFYDFGWWMPAQTQDGMIAMNNLDKFTLSSSANALAPIYLGPDTFHCTVIGYNINDTVVDEGTGNILINVRRGHRPHSAVGFSSQARPGIERFIPVWPGKGLK